MKRLLLLAMFLMPLLSAQYTPPGSGGGSLANTPSCSKYTVAFNNAAFAGSVTTADVSLFTMPAQGKITGITAKPSTAFTGITNENSANGVTVSVGWAAGSQRLAYIGACDIGQVASNTNMCDMGGHYSPTFASHTVTATFTSSCTSGTCFLSTLAAGSVDIWACTVTLP